MGGWPPWNHGSFMISSREHRRYGSRTSIFSIRLRINTKRWAAMYMKLKIQTGKIVQWCRESERNKGEEHLQKNRYKNIYKRRNQNHSRQVWNWQSFVGLALSITLLCDHYIKRLSFSFQPSIWGLMSFINNQAHKSSNIANQIHGFTIDYE